MSSTRDSERAKTPLTQINRNHIKTDELGFNTQDGRRQCRICKEELSCRRDNMFRHFHHRHYSQLMNLVGVCVVESPITTKQQYIDNCIEMMVSCNLPFSFWNQPAVQQNQECFMKEFDMTCSAEFMQDLLTTYSGNVRERVVSDLEDRSVSIMLDIAAKHNRRFLGVAVQYMEKWEMKIRYLSLKDITGITDSMAIQKLIDEALQDNGLQWSNVYAATTASWGNLRKTTGTQQAALTAPQIKMEVEEEDDFKEMAFIADLMASKGDDNDQDDAELDFGEPETVEEQEDIHRVVEEAVNRQCSAESTRCASHIIQQTYKDFMKSGGRGQMVKGLQETVRAARKFILQLPDKPCPPTLAKDTRCASVYEMISSLIAVREHLVDSKIRIDWDQLVDLRDLLSPVHVLIQELLCVQYTVGDFTLSHAKALFGLDRIQRKQPRLKAVAHEMEEALERATEPITTTLQFQAAMYMDPRFNNQHSRKLSEERRIQIVDYLVTVLATVSDECPDTRSASPTFDQYMAELRGNVVIPESSAHLSLRQQLMNFPRRPHVELNDCVFTYWRQRVESMPELTALAELVLAFPVTHRKVEREFDSISPYLTDKRSRLSSATVKDIINVQLNALSSDK